MDVESHVPSARERRPTLVEERAPEEMTNAGRRVSEDIHYGTMAVETTQVNDGTTEGISPSAPRYVPAFNGQRKAPPPLRSSRERSLGVGDEHGAAVAAAASAYCVKENIPKKASTKASTKEYSAVPEPAEAEGTREIEDVDTTVAVDEKYDRAEWVDDEVIEDGGLTAALATNPGIDEEDDCHGWEVQSSMSTPAIITTIEAERPGVARAPSPPRHETVVIGDTTDIPYMSTEELSATPTPKEEKQQPQGVIPVYSLALQQAEAERSVVEANKSHTEELARTEGERPKEEKTPRIPLACESAALQAEAEGEVLSAKAPISQERAGEEATKPEQIPAEFRAHERTGVEPLQEKNTVEQPTQFRKEGDQKAGVVAGVKEAPHMKAAPEYVETPAEVPEQYRITIGAPTFIPPGPTAIPQPEPPPLTMQQQFHEEAEMQASPKPPETKEPVPPVSVPKQEKPKAAPEEPRKAAKPQAPVQEPTAPAPTAAEPREAAKPQAPVQEPTAPAPTAAGPREAVAPPHEEGTSHKASRSERRRAEKEAKAQEKQRQKEEKARLKEEKKQQKHADKRQSEERKESQEDTANQGGTQRRDSKMEQDQGFINKFLRRMSSKPTDNAAGGGSGSAAGGEQPGTTTAGSTAEQNATTNQPAVVAS
ncbi:hypothetical protein PRK78_007499 [Emydomyces testavorans]|uniref:Uncharacterized protein n=1 Tax=Emydomyces testavorans TaxID=2070801 RepID=A0AAF0DPC7_9EURO|nr:hypothetical protein PRK78_007499 [Emydomyces testavorans]